MPKLPRLTSKKLIAILLKRGFVVDRQRGSHVVLSHPDIGRTVIPKHTGDLRLGTLNGILNDLQWSVEELIEML